METILKKLTKDWLEQFARDAQIQADLIGWKKMMVKINKVLDDAIEKQTKEESVKIWLGKLQHLACDVDYLLDEFQTEAFQMMLLEDADAMSKVKEVNARLQDIAWQMNVLGLKESSGGKSRNVRQRFLTTPSLILAAVRGGSRDRGPAIFSPLIKVGDDLAFLEKEDCFASLEKIRSCSDREVYKAELPGSNGMMITIKKVIQPAKSGVELIKQDSVPLPQKMSQIRSEIMNAGLRHRNIVPLLAHVVRPDCHLLVYEFTKNGSLHDILNDVSQGRRQLEWLARHRIARGIASGLEFLHMSHMPRIIHRDIRPANVLIDDDMEARISEFGLAKQIPDGHTRISTSSLVGTVGYMAPECPQTLTFSDKSDIYSFGVLLAVLVMGKFPSDDFFQHTEEMSLVQWMRNVMTSENPNRAIDSKLLGNGYEEQMLLVLKLACFCTLEDPDERPNSKDVSFGVLLAVLVMGKFPSDDFFQHTEEMSFVKWRRNVMNSANPNRAIDSKLLGNGYEEQMLLVLKIANFCTMDDPKQRPNSRDVRCMLSQIQH
ncbi:leucine-rich repeat receptor-like serine/threonine/tyrosine-protein kinase SOBIR1 [Citrus sinensis]|nr:leucine-rich repeat receptor-like serine/threonine/tyrosine-protein kinase SOBIR1 [Citrus sinensis]